jgi:carbamoyl-phosphate synthase large subunit
MTCVLLSSAGRRVELLRCLQADLRELGIPGKVVATDASSLTSAGMLADAFELVPRVDDPRYLDALLDVVARHRVELIIPTIDTELAILADVADQLRDRGTTVLSSGSETVRIAADKHETHRFLDKHGLPSPQQWSAVDARERADRLPYPVIIKPRQGSSSIGVTRIEDPASLHAGLGNGQQIVESVAPGREYTVDVWVDRSGRARLAVPRRRIETRGGEVSVGLTERHPQVIALAGRIAECLPDAYGPLTIQIFADGENVEAIEVNARYGGGYPLSWEAGARTTRWAIQDALGQAQDPEEIGWREGLLMLRHDASVFVPREDLLA